VRELDSERCAVTVPYGWRTTNPFRSTYFAALGMAASAGTRPDCCLAACSRGSPGSAGRPTGFTDRRTGEPATARMETVGRTPDRVVVARFAFTWSFRRRSKR